MCDVCLSDYHDVDEGLLAIMRVVPAMPVRHHDLVSVERKVSLSFSSRPKGSQGRRKPVTSRERKGYVTLWRSRGERFLRCRMQVIVRIRLMVGDIPCQRRSEPRMCLASPRLGPTKNVRKAEEITLRVPLRVTHVANQETRKGQGKHTGSECGCVHEKIVVGGGHRIRIRLSKNTDSPV